MVAREPTKTARLFEKLNQREDFTPITPFASNLDRLGPHMARATRLAKKTRWGKKTPIVVALRKHVPTFFPSQFRKSELKHITFDFIPKEKDLIHYSNADRWRSSVRGSAGHLTLSISGKHAVITEIQGHAATDLTDDLKPLPKEVRENNKKWQEVLIHSAIEYCEQNGLNLWILHETEYKKAGEEGKKAETYDSNGRKVNIPAFYWPFRKKFALTEQPTVDPVFGKHQAFPVYLHEK